ncbi:MAG: GNAT family N-acetyltransferase [Edaphobacter sp.]|uniref:GNAT family N-acetyltransferase n=1 Tax=Edaphobacter sp. TaxID=1934404 RepID=UPI00239CE2D4|nr:GNAT family N-acetyltransferase [Edaphobacter sp.]MDE1176850.1 GNAT family N-acetyltransferase [Edaphobacter sp.]
MPALELRDATPEDVEEIASIYRHYVLTSAATMELEPPDGIEMRRRLNDVHGRGLPFFIAEAEGKTVGYGYAAPFRPRPGYCYTVEDSIYVRAEEAGLGYGRQILAAVIDACREYGARQMIAVIGGVNEPSMAMHRALGFVEAGVLRGAGWKFDQPQDITLMQLAL